MVPDFPVWRARRNNASSRCDSRGKEPRKNRFAFSGAEAPSWRDARRAHTRVHVTDEPRSQLGWTAPQDVKLFLRGDLVITRK